jgi:thiol-disulfide isomerase/thioredoxin
MILLLALACVHDDTPLALAVCKATPGLSMDAAGQAHLAELVDPAELEIWASEGSDYGLGIRALGLGGYGTIRANASCRMESLGWDTAQVVRSTPDFTLIDPFEPTAVWEQPLVETPLTLSLISLPDERRVVHLDLERARSEADAARVLADAGDFEGATAALNALQVWFGDPMIHFELAEVERKKLLAERDRTLTDLEGGTTQLSQVAARATLIVMWTPECEDCPKALTVLSEIAAAEPDLSVITLVPAGSVVPDVAVPVYVQPEGWFEPDGLPYLVLLDPELQVAWRWTGFDESDTNSLRKSLAGAVHYALK